MALGKPNPLHQTLAPIILTIRLDGNKIGALRLFYKQTKFAPSSGELNMSKKLRSKSDGSKQLVSSMG